MPKHAFPLLPSLLLGCVFGGGYGTRREACGIFKGCYSMLRCGRMKERRSILLAKRGVAGGADKRKGEWGDRRMHISSSLLLLLLLLFLSDLDCMLLCYFSPVATSFYSPPASLSAIVLLAAAYAHLEREGGEGQILTGYRRRSRIRFYQTFFGRKTYFRQCKNWNNQRKASILYALLIWW